MEFVTMRLALRHGSARGASVTAVAWRVSDDQVCFRRRGVDAAGRECRRSADRLRIACPYTVNRPSCLSWAGPYIGGNLGYAWGSVNNPTSVGRAGGVQAGYNWQSGPGIRSSDIQITGADDLSRPGSSPTLVRTVRGRPAMPSTNYLYGIRRLAFGELRADFRCRKPIPTAAGLSAPARIRPGQMDRKIEYLYAICQQQTQH